VTRPRPGRRVARSLGVAIAWALVLAGCGGHDRKGGQEAAARRFPVPLFDGLSLGMTRGEVAKSHPIRPALTSSGKTRRLWVYDRPGEFSADLAFKEDSDTAPLARVDVHFPPGETTSDQFIARFERELGPPDARRRKADINAYGDRSHDQYETIWSDPTQYLFLTERVPAGESRGRPVFFLTIKRKEITATGPPTGYVPPPPPKGKDGKPIEESPF
jgi:hypothetical protein